MPLELKETKRPLFKWENMIFCVSLLYSISISQMKNIIFPLGPLLRLWRLIMSSQGYLTAIYVFLCGIFISRDILYLLWLHYILHLSLLKRFVTVIVISCCSRKKENIATLPKWAHIHNKPSMGTFNICIISRLVVWRITKKQKPFQPERWLHTVCVWSPWPPRSSPPTPDPPPHGAAASLRTVLTAAQEAGDSDVTSN